MSGLRDMSVIEEAPTNRQPVQTYVLEHDDAVINEAIRRELRRGGQVFYLHNNVETISSCAAKIQEAVPEAKIAIGHGKMKEGELSEVWRQMLEQEIDVLVCTTIIETGVDLPNANTLIMKMPTVWDFRSCISSEAVWAEVHEGHMPTLPSDGTRFSRRFSRKGLPQSGNLQNSAAVSALQCVTLNCEVRAILWAHSSTGIWNRSVTICTSSFLMRQ